MEFKKITRQDIADHIGKSKDTVDGWKSRQPELLEVATIGTFCKINGLDIEKIKKLIELQEMIKAK